MELNVNPPDSFLLGGPKDAVAAVLETEAAIKTVLEALQEAGLTIMSEEVLILQGEAGAELVDVRGEHHGFIAKLVRSVQQAANQLDTTEKVVKELLAGRYAIIIPGATREERLQIRDILEMHNAAYITLFGKLGPGSGAW